MGSQESDMTEQLDTHSVWEMSGLSRIKFEIPGKQGNCAYKSVHM